MNSQEYSGEQSPEQRLEDLRMKIEQARIDLQGLKSRTFSAQPHFHGIETGTVDAEMIKQSRTARESLAQEKNDELKRLENEWSDLMRQTGLTYIHGVGYKKTA